MSAGFDPFKDGWSMTVNIDPKSMVAGVSASMTRGYAEHGSFPTAIATQIPMFGQHGRFVFVTTLAGFNAIVSQPKYFIKGHAGDLLAERLMKGHTLTTTVAGHPAREVRRPLMQTLDDLYHRAALTGMFKPILYGLTTELAKGSDNPRMVIHRYFAQYLNEVFFNGSFPHLQQLTADVQAELAKLLPYEFAVNGGLNIIVRLAGFAGSRGIVEAAAAVRTQVEELILQAKSNPNQSYGVLDVVRDMELAQASAHVQGVLQGLLDTTGNTAMAMLWVLNTQTHLRKVILDNNAYEQAAKMVVALIPPAPFMLRETTVDMNFAGLDVPKGTKVMASIYHVARGLLGITEFGLDLSYVDALQRFILNDKNAQVAANLPFGGPSATHCIGHIPAIGMLTEFSQYNVDNNVRFHLGGEPNYVVTTTAALDGISVR